jgi:hypothetical protein
VIFAGLCIEKREAHPQRPLPRALLLVAVAALRRGSQAALRNSVSLAPKLMVDSFLFFGIVRILRDEWMQKIVRVVSWMFGRA